MQRLVNWLEPAMHSRGLQFNAAKCEYISPSPGCISMRGGDVWAAAGACRYLGIWITANLDWAGGMRKIWERTCSKLQAMLMKGTDTEAMVAAINHSLLPSILYALPFMTPSRGEINAIEKLISIAARKTTSPNMLELLLYLGRAREPGWGMDRLSERLRTERARKLLAILEGEETLAGFGFAPLLHCIVSKEAAWRIANRQHTSADKNGLFLAVSDMADSGWQLRPPEARQQQVRKCTASGATRHLVTPKHTATDTDATADSHGRGLCDLPGRSHEPGAKCSLSAYTRATTWCERAAPAMCRQDRVTASAEVALKHKHDKADIALRTPVPLMHSLREVINSLALPDVPNVYEVTGSPFVTIGLPAIHACTLPEPCALSQTDSRTGKQCGELAGPFLLVVLPTSFPDPLAAAPAVAKIRAYLPPIGLTTGSRPPIEIWLDHVRQDDCISIAGRTLDGHRKECYATLRGCEVPLDTIRQRIADAKARGRRDEQSAAGCPMCASKLQPRRRDGSVSSPCCPVPIWPASVYSVGGQESPLALVTLRPPPPHTTNTTVLAT
ncbi:hypothetical protein, partial [Herbaspirillum sp.]|uniref:hypothetical protein n=1 Tax=Herbaspirillum sp. TaxID=1890675 RepID=UPI0025825ACD